VCPRCLRDWDGKHGHGAGPQDWCLGPLPWNLHRYYDGKHGCPACNM
jgi:hypothetical protein